MATMGDPGVDGNLNLRLSTSHQCIVSGPGADVIKFLFDSQCSVVAARMRDSFGNIHRAYLLAETADGAFSGLGPAASAMEFFYLAGRNAGAGTGAFVHCLWDS